MSNSADLPRKKKGRGRLISTIRIVLLLSVLFTGSCTTTHTPSARLPYGGVSRLMEMPEFKEVQTSTPAVKRWAKTALEEVNDLELNYQLKK